MHKLVLPAKVDSLKWTNEKTRGRIENMDDVTMKITAVAPDWEGMVSNYIDDVKIDGKHSFEDVVLPVTEAKVQYGDRLTLLGGMDVDLLTRSGEADIRSRTREILNVCLPGGGYFLGLGNWVTEYIPTRNYLVMLDEARRI